MTSPRGSRKYCLRFGLLRSHFYLSIVSLERLGTPVGRLARQGLLDTCIFAARSPVKKALRRIFHTHKLVLGRPPFSHSNYHLAFQSWSPTRKPNTGLLEACSCSCVARVREADTRVSHGARVEGVEHTMSSHARGRSRAKGIITDFTGLSFTPEILSKFLMILQRHRKFLSSALMATPLPSANNLCNRVLPFYMLTPTSSLFRSPSLSSLIKG
ncbi:hypothetical protein R1flu_004081 [Riccia fluitans]|uniref:Uncharacterized protein n=1 Tax=Riccia fluitans TaxID=41844 RepID=A0ABD1YT79_9MARC